MSDKKNEDYAIRMPDSATRSSPAYGGEKDAFLGRPSRGGSSGGGFQQSLSNVENNGPVSILAYCLASISMTIVNKYVVSGHEWNMTFLYLAVQVRQIPPLPHQWTASCQNHEHLDILTPSSCFSQSCVLLPSRYADRWA